MNSTTTCAFTNPVLYDGSSVSSSSENFAFNTLTCSTEYATSSGQIYAGGFSYGELIISVLLFFTLMTVAYSFFFSWVRGVKVRS